MAGIVHQGNLKFYFNFGTVANWIALVSKNMIKKINKTCFQSVWHTL